MGWHFWINKIVIGQKYLFDFVIFGGWGNEHTSLILGLRGGGVHTVLIFTLENFWPGPPSHILNNPNIVSGLITNAFTNPLYGIRYFIPHETITITKHKSVITLVWTAYWFPLCKTPYELFLSIFQNQAKLKKNCRL